MDELITWLVLESLASVLVGYLIEEARNPWPLIRYPLPLIANTAMPTVTDLHRPSWIEDTSNG